VRVEVLDGPALREAEPNLRHDLVGALRVVDDAVLYPPCAARFLLEQAKPFRAEARTHCTVRKIGDDGMVLLADRTRICAGLCVNAAGCWPPTLTPDLPVRKRKGHLVITDRYPGYVRHQIIELGYLKSAHAADQANSLRGSGSSGGYLQCPIIAAVGWSAREATDTWKP
jgi:glycine/D-amino acid oxidase-like deaminating enzyme